MAFQRGGAQIHHRTPRLGEAVAGHAAGHVEILPDRRLIFGYAHGDGVELGSDTDEALGQCIVDLAGQAGALTQDQRKAVTDAAQAHLIGGPGAGKQQPTAEQPEPNGFVIMRQNVEGEGLFRGRAPGNLGSHREGIVAMLEAVVVDLAAGAGAHPAGLQAGELIKVLHPFGGAQVDGGIADAKTLDVGGEAGGLGEIDRIGIGGDVQQLNGGRH